jgi:hypothetical protein
MRATIWSFVASSTQTYPLVLDIPQISLRVGCARNPESPGPTITVARTRRLTKSTTDTLPSPSFPTYAHNLSPGRKNDGRNSSATSRAASPIKRVLIKISRKLRRRRGIAK